MSTVEKVSANYTAEQVAALENAAPVSYFDAVELAENMGKSVRSVIAKVQSLELEYIPKPKPVKREKGRTKAETAALIRESLNDAVIPNLEKAPANALNALLEAVSS